MLICIFPFAAAEVLTGNFTLADVDDNPSAAAFNFTSNTSGAAGHFIANVTESPGMMVGMRGSIRFRNIGVRTYTEFLNTNKVILYNFTDEWGQGYSTGDGWGGFFPPSSGDAVQFIISNGSTGWYHGLMWIANITTGINVSIFYKLNNQSNNNTFASLSSCEMHTNPSSCSSDFANNCEWANTGALCKQRPEGFHHDIPPADCSMLPERACKSVNTTVCSWNPTSGRFGKCEPGQLFSPFNGFNCTNIINQSFCNNQHFSERTGLCTWNGGTSTCAKNNSKTFEHIEKPPVFFCEASGYVNNRTKCENLSNHYYMPCGWDNSTNKCGPIFFDFNEFKNFDDIGSESNCQTAGGTWRTESTYDPANDLITSESWCEFGVSVKSFDAIGGGTSSFGGSSGQLRDCSVDCFACEFQSNGTSWNSQAAAQSACQSSGAGCNFRADSNAFNGHGWCNPAAGFGGFNCEINCGDCMLMPQPNSSCINSPAQCKWDNITNFCIGAGVKGCNQECQQCHDQADCQLSPASGGCSWDSNAFYCTPSSGKFEICFDGVDNDNNQKTDCADSKCSTDPFCGGGFADSNNCFQHELFKYNGNVNYAKGNCSGTSGCHWISESANFGFCAPVSEMCFENSTLQDNQNLCDNFNDGETCTFVAETRCSENNTMIDICEQFTTNTTCMRANNTGCQWDSGLGGGFGECDSKAFFGCDMNPRLQNNQSACVAAGCAWLGGQFGSGFEGGFANNCVNPCANASITSQSACAAANGSNFVAGTCAWQIGFCEPNNFIGGCEENDGDISACTDNSNCKWFADSYGPIVDPNGSTNFADYLHAGGSTWIAIGLQKPKLSAGRNESNYTLTLGGANYLTLAMTRENVSVASALRANISRIYCGESILLDYNFSDGNCRSGSCNSYNGSARCGGQNLHYFLNTSQGILEAMWEVPTTMLQLDAIDGNAIVTSTQISATVLIDGSLSEQINESASAGDGTNATRVLTSSGFCNGGLTNQFFQGMEDSPPVPLAADPSGDAAVSYLDITGIGVKKTDEAYMYGIPVVNISHSSLCNGVLLRDNTLGGGKNASKYFLYLDTDGKTTGGCKPENAPTDSSLARFEYRFKYVAETDSDTGKLSETLLSQSCFNNSWIPSNIPFKSDKKKSCSVIGGPIFGIDKDTFTGKGNVNTSIAWAAYAVTAGGNGNASAINDSAGPGSADFKGIDAELIDCTSTTDKDNSQCTKFKQFGFFPGEFGPACKDSKDNDGDGLTDCSDYDCIFDPFFCSGSFGASFLATIDDDTAPSIVWSKVNSKLPNALAFIYDTNEPANGSVRYYYNDSSCASANATYYDAALSSGDSHTYFRPHHITDLMGLQANRTYFYKLEVCDPSGNCAVSKCANATTASSHSNITFKLEIPSGWGVDIPSMNLTNYNRSYALKASTELLFGMNMTVRKSDNSTAITFVGIDIFEKQTLNVSEFISGSSFVGFDANQYQSFKQKTGLEETLVKIPSAGSIIQHCDEDGENCQAVTDNVDCEFFSSYTSCEVPDAVGLGFSTYKASSASPGSSGGSGGGGSSGGSGGGGGGALTSPAGTTKTQFWQEIEAHDEVILTIGKSAIAIGMIAFSLGEKAASAEIAVTALAQAPPIEAAPNSVYQYLKIDKKNIEDASLLNPEIEFFVGKAWFSENSVSAKDVRLYRFNNNAWQELSTTLISSDGANSYYRSVTPGFSYFAIAGKSQAEAQAQLESDLNPIDAMASAPPAVEEPKEITEPAENKQSQVNPLMIYVGFIAVFLVVVGSVLYYWKRK